MNETTAEVRLIASQKNWIEGSAVQQLEKTATLTGMRLAVGLPDLHPGKVSPIGAAFVVEGRVYPALVGNDIGCGIALWRTRLSAKAGKREAWAERLRDLDGAWNGDAVAFLNSRGIETSGFEHSLGTIGSGNHFGELQIAENITAPDSCGITPDSVYLCVHSGSRGFGEAILREHTERFGAGGLEIGIPMRTAISGFTTTRNGGHRPIGNSSRYGCSNGSERKASDCWTSATTRSSVARSEAATVGFIGRAPRRPPMVS